MNAYVAELQLATEGQIIDWQAFPDRPEAHAIGVHNGVGYVLTVKRHANVWKWSASAGGGRIRSHFHATAQEAIDAANAAYARFADENRYPQEVSA